MSLMLCGTGVSRGIVIAPIRVMHDVQPHMSRRQVTRARIPAELRRLERAIERTARELRGVKNRALDSLPREIGAVLDSHILMLADEAFSGPVMQLIEDRGYSAEWAISVHSESVLRAFDQIADPYLRARREDVQNMVARLLRVLKRSRRVRPAPEHDKGYVLVTSQLAPADLLVHRDDGMLGVISEHGGPLSHATIVARSLGVPAVAGAHGATTLLGEDDLVVLDGSSGMVVAGPDTRSLRVCRTRQRAERRRRREFTDLRSAPSVTGDGVRVHLRVNVEITGDLAMARRYQADGIGLYRTESLYLNRNDLPDETEHYDTYRKILRSMRGAPVTVRTMDIWAGSRTPALDSQIPRAAQPALGLRAIRLCLRHPELFAPQLRALLRAAAHGPLRILLPMLSSVRELDDTLALIERTKQALASDGVRYGAHIPIGVMIEVPSAALSAAAFAKRVDFLSIGTNDLIQYTLAIDRTDDAVQQLYDPLNPAVLKLIDMTLKAGAQAGVPVSLCGEMAGDPIYTRLLLGLGLTDFSMHPASLLEVKRAVRETDVSTLSARCRRLLRSESPESSQRLLERLNHS